MKLREITYIDAEALASAEMQHGPMAVITDDLLAGFTALCSDTYDKMVGNVEQVRAPKGRAIVLATGGNESSAVSVPT